MSTAAAAGPPDGPDAPGAPVAPGSRGMHDPDPGIAFWPALVVGGAVSAYGPRGLFEAFGPEGVVALGKWVVGTIVVHDGILAPAVTVAGLVLGRLLPISVRGPVRGGLALTALVILFSWPLLRGWGRRSENATTLPLDYPRTVATVLVAVWLAAGVVLVWRRFGPAESAAPAAPRRVPDDERRAR